MIDMESIVRVLRKIEESCFETKQKNKAIVYAVGGIESFGANYKHCLHSAICVLNRINKENLKKIIKPLSGLYTSDVISQTVYDYLKGEEA